MTNNQNKFYTSISKYYSEIFPFNPVQLDFVEKQVGDLTGKQILDIGCATGELAYQLAKEGANVTGIDLNEDLLEQAKQNKQLPNLQFKRGDMLNLEQDYSRDEFDVVLCFGNTLVHLPDFRSVNKMLQSVYSILKPGGKFLMQILNYDYILDEKVSGLPLIEGEDVRFVRRYKFEENNNLILFQTDLYLKKEDQVISNETKLFGLKSQDLVDLLKQTGFKNIQLYSNFNEEDFGGQHLPLVVSAVK